MYYFFQLSLFFLASVSLNAQLNWRNVDSLYQPLPPSVHVYYTDDSLDKAPFRAFYLIADLNDKKIDFTVDTSKDRRLKPQDFYERNDKAIAVVNTTFFSFQTNRNLNTVIRDGKLVSYNIHTINGRGRDTFTYRHPFPSAIGISKKRKADIAWVFTDSSLKRAMASQSVIEPIKDSIDKPDFQYINYATSLVPGHRGKLVPSFYKWKMRTAVGGGPVLVQLGKVSITNNEEMRFAGRAINDKHPRTAMGYTKDGKLLILVVEGRNANAAGATLTQEAEILRDLGCWEALNLDGGGSSCLLINGKETIRPSDKEGQRAVPAVLVIKKIGKGR